MSEKELGEPMPFCSRRRRFRFIPARDAEFDNMRRFYRTELVKVELQS